MLEASSANNNITHEVSGESFRARHSCNMEENSNVDYIYFTYMKLKHFFTSQNFTKGFTIGVVICSIMGLVILISRRCIQWYRNPNTRPRMLHRTKRHHFGNEARASTAKSRQKKRTNKPISVFVVSKNMPSRLTSAAVPDTSAHGSVQKKVKQELKFSNTYQDGEASIKRVNSTAMNMIKGILTGFATATLAVAAIFISEWYCGPGSIKHALVGSSSSYKNVTSSTTLLSSNTPVYSTYESGAVFVFEDDYMSIILIVVAVLVGIYRCAQRVWFPERRRVWLDGDRSRYYVNRQGRP